MLQIDRPEITPAAPEDAQPPHGLKRFAAAVLIASLSVGSWALYRTEHASAIGQCPGGWPDTTATKVFRPAVSYISFEMGVSVLSRQLKNEGIVVARSVQPDSFEVYSDQTGNLPAAAMAAAKLIYKTVNSGQDTAFVVNNHNRLSSLGQVFCVNPADNGPSVAFTPTAQQAINAMEQTGTSFDWQDGLAIANQEPSPSAQAANQAI